MGVKLDRCLFMGVILVRPIRVQLGLKQLGVVFNSYSNPLRLRLRGRYIMYSDYTSLSDL